MLSYYKSCDPAESCAEASTTHMHKRINLIFLSLLALVTMTARGQGPSDLGELSAERIQQIAGFLPDQPAGLSKPIGDRAYWMEPKRVAELHPFIGKAEKLLTTPFPAWSDDDYLDFTRTGNRPRGEKMMAARENWISVLAYAECLENKGRFLPVLNKVIRANASDPTWTLPAHDASLTSFHGTDYFVDLGASTFGCKLAETLYLLGDKIDPAVRELVLRRLEQRIFEPFRRTVATGRPCEWLGSQKSPKQNNWNPVCLSGIVGSALSVIPDKQARAFYVAAAEHYSVYYLNSFTDDGYCTEGPGYWDYGFGHYAALREEMIEATGGKVDLFAQPRVIPCILYGERIKIGPNAVPPFADCPFGSKINPDVLAYCQDALALDLKAPPFSQHFDFAGTLGEVDATPCTTPAKASSEPEDPLRFYFKDVGVLVCRSSEQHGMGIGIKSGGNFSHSHNDIGSYEIAVGDDEPTGDPGGPKFYDKDTFGPKRNESKLINSYGHPVPVVGGQLQINAIKAKPVVLSTSFSPQRDEIVIDLAPAYAVASMQKLTRTMDDTRTGAGQVVITDEANFSSPTTFEDAIITRGDWKEIDATTLSLSMGNAKLIAKISSSADFKLKPETIQNLGVTFTRIGLVFSRPCLTARIGITFTRGR